VRRFIKKLFRNLLKVGIEGSLMEHDEKIPSYISKDQNISQRQLAKLTDLSVGHFNFLLHKMVNKGLLTIENVNYRNLQYVITPKGIAKNTKRMYCYVKDAKACFAVENGARVKF